MLPTNEKAILGLYSNSNELTITHDKLASIPKYQHLYILSDEEIKENTYCLCLKTNTVFEINKIINNEIVISKHGLLKYNYKDCRNIVASSDILTISIEENINDTTFIKKFYTPQIPQSFIEYFISEYNKDNIITEVLVEYEEILGDEGIIKVAFGETDFKLKINPDNTINIKPIKNSWSREDYQFAKYIILRFKNHANIHGYPSKSFKQKVDKWIEENI